MSSLMMDLLKEHVPITLLLDLCSPAGPASRELFEAEGGDAAWLLPRAR